jgi:hypothetical protein
MTYETELSPSTQRSFKASVREARMAVSRVLLTCELPSGFVHAVTETILLSQAAGLSGFKGLTADYALLDMSGHSGVELHDIEPGSFRFNANGLHAWLVAPTLMDLLVDEARKSGSAKAEVLNVQRISELNVLMSLAARYGAVAVVSAVPGQEDAVTIQLTNTSFPRTSEQWDPLLDAAIRGGFPMEASDWWEVYELSNRALAPDSVLSRRHAGPVIMLDDGSIQGRLPEDDDFDPAMLKSVSANPEAK